MIILNSHVTNLWNCPILLLVYVDCVIQDPMMPVNTLSKEVRKTPTLCEAGGTSSNMHPAVQPLLSPLGRSQSLHVQLFIFVY